MKRPREGGLLKMAQLIDQSPRLRFLGVVDDKRQVEALACWAKAAGDAVARQTRPLKWKKDVLHVAVASPAWMQELTLQKPALLANLAGLMGSRAPKDLKFSLSESGWRKG